MKHSVESRFFAIVCGALLVFVVPLFALFLILASGRAAAEREDHAAILLSAYSQAVGKPLWDFDGEGLSRIVETIITDPYVLAATVTDTSGKMNFTRERSPPAAFPDMRSVSQDIAYETLDGKKTIGRITIQFAQATLLSPLRQMELAFIAIFIVAILIVFAAALVGNRLMIITPLLRLTAAVEATRRLGSHHHVDWQSGDEMGKLASSFNEMQSKLEREETELKLAHRRATDIYNLTPAMLFSLDPAGRITAVSDYWIAATGYRRADVIGLSFADLIEAGTRGRYLTRKDDGKGRGSTWEVTVKFLCADGRVMDALIAETRTTGVEHQGGLSLSVMTDVTELKESESRNHLQAITDHLTNLPNRQGLEAALAAKIGEAEAGGLELAFLFIDLDRFKWVNDNLGHAAGDLVLFQFVERMLPLLRSGDMAARLGGDEFAILLMAENAEEPALELTRRLTRVFDRPFTANGAEAHLSASIGIALYPRHARTAAELLQKSDMAMYARKRDGKNGAVMFDPAMLDAACKRAEIECDIEAGLTEDWFDIYLQPVVDLNERRVVGFEALMRLNHPHKGVLPPADIVNVAEETGSITRIGDRIMEKALASLVEMSKVQGLEEAYLAINFSPLQIEPDLPARLAGLLAIHDIHPRRIILEITEAVLMHDNPEIRTLLEDISKFGCRIALDDFGTGYSSLSYMNRFPVDIVKIDQSFTHAMTGPAAAMRQKSRMLVEGIAAISHKMKCVVIAEGVETHEQLLLLTQMGVDCGQGYFFSRPQPVRKLFETFSAGTPLLLTGAA